MTLSYLQQRFIDEYVASPANAAEAARKAGYSINRAKVTACELLKNPEVIHEIQLIRTRYQANLNYTREVAAKDLLKIVNDVNCPARHKIPAIKELGMLFGLYPN